MLYIAIHPWYIYTLRFWSIQAPSQMTTIHLLPLNPQMVTPIYSLASQYQG